MLLVPSIGEIDSLKYLTNQQCHVNSLIDTSPKNLILKLFTSNITPSISDTPSLYTEPNSFGYPNCINNREDQNYSNNTGILLNGSRWQINTSYNSIGSSISSSGLASQNTITLINYTGQLPLPGDIVGTVSGNSYKVPSGISGSAVSPTLITNVGSFTNTSGNIVTNGTGIITINNTLLNFVSDSINITGSNTTTSYPQQTFTFTGAVGIIYGYFVTRANNMPSNISGVSGAATATPTKFTITNCSGINGNSYFNIPLTTLTSSNITIGMRVISDNANTGTSGIPGGRTIIGIDRISTTDTSKSTIYIDSPLTLDISSINNNTSLDFNYSVLSINDNNPHGLVPGDIIYIDKESSPNLIPNTYTVFTTPNSTSFTTTPALYQPSDDSLVNGTCTLYNSIVFAERFTNGPYTVRQNNDTIKVSLNISLN
jgi:hypothetical protein